MNVFSNTLFSKWISSEGNSGEIQTFNLDIPAMLPDKVGRLCNDFEIGPQSLEMKWSNSESSGHLQTPELKRWRPFRDRLLGMDRMITSSKSSVNLQLFDDDVRSNRGPSVFSEVVIRFIGLLHLDRKSKMSVNFMSPDKDQGGCQGHRSFHRKRRLNSKGFACIIPSVPIDQDLQVSRPLREAGCLHDWKWSLPIPSGR